jgi:signal transduction histidine kinase
MHRFLNGIWLIFCALAISGSLFFLALLVLGYANNVGGVPSEHCSASDVAAALSESSDGGFVLSSDIHTALLAEGSWAMLLDKAGTVIWSEHKPPEIGDSFTSAQIASFSHWYLKDYPVSVWQYGDGIVVVGARKDSQTKYNLVYSKQEFVNQISITPFFFFSILCAMLLFGRHSFRKEQTRRDAARSRWINGISHDIRTPLSIVMGYAGEWQADTSLPEPYRRQASAMVSACNSVKALVADLNLTMRLDYEMQPLRREVVLPAALLRTAAADALNSGLLTDIELEISRQAEALRLSADPVLLGRALANLLQNAARHGSAGMVVLRLSNERRRCVISVQSVCTEDASALLAALNHQREPTVERDGAAAHGTGLRLVQQVAKVHHGSLRFTAPDAHTLCAQLRLPLYRRKVLISRTVEAKASNAGQ